MNRNLFVYAIRTAGIAAVVGLALLLAGRLQARSEIATLEARFSRKVGPLDPSAYASPVVPDAENAAIWLRSAAAALELSDIDKQLIASFNPLTDGNVTPELLRDLERVFSRNAPALAMTQKASSMPRSGYLLSGEDAVRTRPDIPLLDLLWLARTINARAAFAVANGDRAVFRSSVAELACIGASLERESPLIAQLVGLAVERMMIGAILFGLQSTPGDPEALRGLEAVIPDVDLVAARRRALGNLGAGVHSGAVELHDMFDQGFTRIVLAVPSVGEYLKVVLGIDGTTETPLGLDPDLGARLEQSKNTEGRTAADTLVGSLVRYQSILSLRRLARLAIDLRLAAMEEGRYPDSLAAWPEAATPDPFTGGEFRYETFDDGSAVLAVPGAEELYNRINEIRTFVPFTWELPAP